MQLTITNIIKELFDIINYIINMIKDDYNVVHIIFWKKI